MTSEGERDGEKSIVALSASELRVRIAAGSVSPVEVVEAFLEWIEAIEPTLHAFVEVYASDARRAASDAAAAIASGRPLGPLCGVPVVLKDLFDLEGRSTTAGSPSRSKHRARASSDVARRLIASGAIVLGKTHTVEFALGGWGTNELLGTPHNPWDMERARTPGGSSSGTAVAVAARMTPWGLGTDTGGSVRLPASFCGLTGLKPTFGRISTVGIVPLSHSFDTVGPIARTADDAQLLFSVLAAPEMVGRSRHELEPDGRQADLRGLRLGQLAERERTGVAPDILAAYDRTLAALATLGAEVVEIHLPFNLDELARRGEILDAEAYFHHGSVAENLQQPMDQGVRLRLLVGREVDLPRYLSAQRFFANCKDQLAVAMNGIDALVTPTTEVTALRLADLDDGRLASRFTRFVNFLDLCAVAAPNGFDRDRLPTSMQIVGRSYHERLILRVAAAYQRITDWHNISPAFCEVS